jgi:hypothetical protein
MRRRKAQGISLNVVVIAAIAMLVLVILTVILIQRTGRVQDQFACSAQPDAQCMVECGGAYPIYAAQYDCRADWSGNPQRCCLADGGTENSGPSSAFN